MKKIALEEHFITSDFVERTKSTDLVAMKPEDADDFLKKLLDIGPMRLQAMDDAGIEISILSLTSPGIQEKYDTKTAVDLAHQTNLFLAKKISENPNRFRGFAALAMQDPQSAVKELDFCINDLKFVGALINGQTNGHYLDDESYLPFWEKVAALNVPVYLHPGSPLHTPENYYNHSELAGPIWGWGVETGTHALRLVFSGLFDRFPNLKVILGHMGESLPYMLWRLDSRWAISKQMKKLNRLPSEYLKSNFYVTTSGMCSNGPLLCALEELGEDRVMFSVDYPYESSEVAAKFIEAAPLSPEVKEKVCYKTAATFL
jgi:2,3-dihydroxybenzoate decarboxylase